MRLNELRYKEESLYSLFLIEKVGYHSTPDISILYVIKNIFKDF
jgi:hypothetical protein